MNWNEIRGRYPALASLTYLNTATFGQVSTTTRAAVNRHFDRRDRLACTDFLTWFDDMDEIRALTARFINCRPEDIAFAMNASSALSLLLGGMQWNPGDRIVTLADEFPNQYYFARSLAAKGVELIEVPAIESLPERTRAVIVSSVNYSNGYRPDLMRISRLAHECGALLYVDGTQSLGALRFDIAAVQPDMLAVDAYKWMLCPNGATFFYISPELRRTLPPAVMGWRSDRGWRSVDDLQHGAPVLPGDAQKYEAGMLNFSSLYGLEDALRTIFEIGPEQIEARVLQLAGVTADILRRSGAVIVNENTNIVAAHWPDRDASALAAKLEEQRIVVAARHGNLRVSPHFYNTEEDLDRLRKALA
jgi:cysteine desulfurase/selenocysteine lyase